MPATSTLQSLVADYLAATKVAATPENVGRYLGFALALVEELSDAEIAELKAGVASGSN